MSNDITPQDSDSLNVQSGPGADGEAEGHGYLPREERGGQGSDGTASVSPHDDGEAEGHLMRR